MNASLPLVSQLATFAAAMMFVTGLRRMSHPGRARSGIHWAGSGMLLALLSLLGQPAGSNLWLIALAILIGGTLSALHARRVAISAVPQTIALYNGFGGGAAASIALIKLMSVAELSASARVVAVLGGLIGCVALAGSFMAWAKLERHISRRHRFDKRQVAYLANVALLLIIGLILAASSQPHPILLAAFLGLALLFGVLMTLPIAAADLPVLISMYNALTGLAVALEGYVLAGPAMMVAGSLVCAAGLLLTRLMARSVNRRLSEIMYSGFGLAPDDGEDLRHDRHMHVIDAMDAAMSLAYAERVVIVPGYGMATAQAQHKVQELTQLLEERGVNVRFAIHPVAGRMPGHMNVLLAEAGVAYDRINDLSEINPELGNMDVALVVGASDIVNPVALSSQPGPLQGMPIIELEQVPRVLMLNLGTQKGYAGIDNPLLYAPNTRTLPGDARRSVQDLISAIKALS